MASVNDDHAAAAGGTGATGADDGGPAAAVARADALGVGVGVDGLSEAVGEGVAGSVGVGVMVVAGAGAEVSGPRLAAIRTLAVTAASARVRTPARRVRRSLRSASEVTPAGIMSLKAAGSDNIRRIGQLENVPVFLPQPGHGIVHGHVVGSVPARHHGCGPQFCLECLLPVTAPVRVPDQVPGHGEQPGHIRAWFISPFLPLLTLTESVVVAHQEVRGLLRPAALIPDGLQARLGTCGDH